MTNSRYINFLRYESQFKIDDNYNSNIININNSIYNNINFC